MQETEAALALLAAGKTDDAIAALERATGKLDIILAADPNLALAPVDIRAIVHDVIAAPEAVTALRQRAEAALDDGRLLIGITYDRKNDLIEIALEELDHLIRSPRELFIDYAVGEVVAAIEIVDADGNRQIVRFKDPLALPAPAEDTEHAAAR